MKKMMGTSGNIVSERIQGVFGEHADRCEIAVDNRETYVKVKGWKQKKVGQMRSFAFFRKEAHKLEKHR